ncbi:MAG TPA: ATPase, T2SS/T4P/T4SS family [Sedimentisphaerales bacterium]|nr:ATPase, T2SS/T4P/T4SS family [Sedimentisphaerales bacterium]
MSQKKLLGELLCERSYLSHRNLEIAIARQKNGARGRRLGEILVEQGYVSEAQLCEALAVQAGIEKVDIEALAISNDVIARVPAELVSKYSVVPVSAENGWIGVAMTDPFNRAAIEDLRLVTGCSIKRYYAHPTAVENAILKFYGSNVARMLEDLAPDEAAAIEGAEDQYSAARLSELAKEPSLVNLVNLIVLEAVEAKASDVHIEPFEKEVRIKYRMDGLLVEKSPSPKRLHAAIVSRIKILGGMNIAERFVPQDGHIEFIGKKGKVDLRVSTVPSVFGESVTLRILDRSASLLTLEDLGMQKQCLSGFEQGLTKAHGIVLVTGPTGSGKTTTLYAALNKIYTPKLKIITIEDPVEYQLDGIIQIAVNPKRGLTFATGLRHILRQDPDIIMVGEIRDRETADIAVRAALTGHLVFSTLHTNDAPGAVTRLTDMGIEPFLLASSLEGVLAQRLVRKICPLCRERYEPATTVLQSLTNAIKLTPDMEFFRGRGCDNCNKSGMKGRMGIFEMLRMTDHLRQLISTRPTADDIRRAAPKDHVSMRHDGIEKILAGITTPEEILRVTHGMEDEKG